MLENTFITFCALSTAKGMKLQMKKVIIMGLFISLLTGCFSNTPTNTIETSDDDNLQSEENENNNIQKQQDKIQTKTTTFISNKEFYQTLKLLNPELADHAIVKETFTKKNPEINQMKIHDENQYIVTWCSDFSEVSSVMIMFEIKDSKAVPIYSDTFRQRIASVKYMGRDYLDKPLVEVTSYGASGSFSGQWVNLLILNDDTVQEVWEYQTISNDSHPSDEKGVMEYGHAYSTYLLMPSFMRRFPEKNDPAIIVNQTMEKIYVSTDEEIVSRNKESKRSLFIWDEKQQWFEHEEYLDNPPSSDDQSNISPTSISLGKSRP